MPLAWDPICAQSRAIQWRRQPVVPELASLGAENAKKLGPQRLRNEGRFGEVFG
jgi:hypothetical protein